MMKNIGQELTAAYRDFLDGKIDRRTLIATAGGLGMSAAGLAMFSRAIPASAQDATPGASPESSPMASPVGGATPAATFPPFKSMTREEFKAALMAWWKDYEKPAKQGGTFIYGDLGSNNLTGFNLVVASSDPTLTFIQAVQEFLVGSSPIDGAFTPALADYYEIAEDGKTYTFHLNEKAMWHDGQPFTADDVVFSFDATKDDKTSSAYTSSFNSVVGSYSKIDDHTVQVVGGRHHSADRLPRSGVERHRAPAHLEGRAAREVAQSTRAIPAPIRAGSSAPVHSSSPKPAPRKAPRRSSRTPDYYDEPAVIDKLIFQTWPDDTALVEALRTGTIDLYQPVNPADVEGLQKGDNTAVSLYDSYTFGWYGYQLDPAKSKLFQDVRTRQALFYAVDRESIVKNIYAGVCVGRRRHPAGAVNGLRPGVGQDALHLRCRQGKKLVGGRRLERHGRRRHSRSERRQVLVQDHLRRRRHQRSACRLPAAGLESDRSGRGSRSGRLRQGARASHHADKRLPDGVACL